MAAKSVRQTAEQKLQWNILPKHTTSVPIQTGTATPHLRATRCDIKYIPPVNEAFLPKKVKPTPIQVSNTNY